MDEAFGFAVGARGVGASEALAEAELMTEAAKDAGAVTRAVVGEQAADRNAEAGVVIDRGLQKSSRGRGFLVGQDLREGDARVIIDGDMDIFPSGTMDAAPPITRNAAADGLKAADFLNVEVEEIAGAGVFVTKHGRRGFEIADAAEVEAAQNAADRGAAESSGQGDPHAGPTLAAQILDANHEVGRATARGAQRAGRMVAETAAAFALVTAHPLGGGFGADFELGCSRVQSHLPHEYGLSERLSTERRKSGILMDVHSMSP